MAGVDCLKMGIELGPLIKALGDGITYGRVMTVAAEILSSPLAI